MSRGFFGGGGNFSAGGANLRAPKARASRAIWGHVPRKFANLGSFKPFPAF